MIADAVNEEPAAKKSLFWRVDKRAKEQVAMGSTSKYVAWEQWSHTSNQSVPIPLRDAFIRFNTTLPSSAPVERLFSLGKRVMTPTRTLLSDTNFEIMVFLGCNL